VQTTNKPVLPSLNGGKGSPVATFKNSLRDWHVRWKAQRLNETRVAGKADNQTSLG
jgi:hypothetical protein